MLVEKNNIDLTEDEDGIWIANSGLLQGCHSSGKTEYEAILNFQEAAKTHQDWSIGNNEAS